MNDEHDINSEISPYQEAIDMKWSEGGARGDDGAYPGLSSDESLFADMWYFWQGCLINSGDVAGWFEFMDSHRNDFTAIGAKGCLEAIEAIRPYFVQATNEGKLKEWHDGWRSRGPGIVAAEDLAFGDGFDSLLLAFAKKHLPSPAK